MGCGLGGFLRGQQSTRYLVVLQMVVLSKEWVAVWWNGCVIVLEKFWSEKSVVTTKYLLVKVTTANIGNGKSWWKQACYITNILCVRRSIEHTKRASSPKWPSKSTGPKTSLGCWVSLSIWPGYEHLIPLCGAWDLGMPQHAAASCAFCCWCGW